MSNGLPLPGSIDMLYPGQKMEEFIAFIMKVMRACKSNAMTITVDRISLKDTCATPIPLSIAMAHPAHLQIHLPQQLANK